MARYVYGRNLSQHMRKETHKRPSPHKNQPEMFNYAHHTCQGVRTQLEKYREVWTEDEFDSLIYKWIESKTLYKREDVNQNVDVDVHAIQDAIPYERWFLVEQVVQAVVIEFILNPYGLTDMDPALPDQPFLWVLTGNPGGHQYGRLADFLDSHSIIYKLACRESSNFHICGC